MAKLEPCPFCGSTKLKIESKSAFCGCNGLGTRVEQHTYSVRCKSCHARGGTAGGRVLPYYTAFYMGEFPLPIWATTDDALKNKAIIAWNRRAGNEAD